MPFTAITRDVSASINDCELSFHRRQPIDVPKAIAQHEAYREGLAELGARIVSLPAEPGLPDAVFVEDAAVVRSTEVGGLRSEVGQPNPAETGRPRDLLQFDLRNAKFECRRTKFETRPNHQMRE